MYINQKIKIIFSVAFIFAGSLLFYFEAYRNIFFLEILYVILISTAWLSLLIIFWENNLFSNKRIKNLNKKSWLNLLMRVLFFAIAIANIIWLSNLSDKRVAEILNHKKFVIAIATVIKLEERFSKTGSQRYAIINYKAGNQIVSQAFYDCNKDCSAGQKIKIKYSKDYPQMFAVLEIPKK